MVAQSIPKPERRSKDSFELLNPLNEPLRSVILIRVTVELLPHGSDIGKRTLGVLEIANNGTGTQAVGNYEATLTAEYTSGRRGKVRSFNRKTQSVWSLVGAFLKLFGHTKHSPKLMETSMESNEGRHQ